MGGSGRGCSATYILAAVRSAIMASRAPLDETTQLVSEYLDSGRDSLTVVVYGKLGAGKTALVNGLVGKVIAKEGVSPVSQTPEVTSHSTEIKVSVGKEGLSPVSQTHEVTPYSTEIKVSIGTRVRAIQTTIWDTPGCADVFEDEANHEANLEKIAEKIQDADLLLYCMNMRDRLTIDDTIGIKELTSRIGHEVWKNAIFVLTFANEVKPSPGSKEGKLKHFEEVFSAWQTQLRTVLIKKVKIPENIATSVAIVPTGYRQSSPPDRDDWLSPFWFEAFLKTKESAQPALLGINLHRLRIQSPFQGKAAADIPQEKQLEAHQQKININPQHLPKTEGKYGEMVGQMALNAIFKPMQQAMGQAVQKLSQKLLSQAVDATTNTLIPTVVTAILAASGWQIATAGLVVGAGIGAGVGVGALIYTVVTYKARKRAETMAIQGQM